MDFNQILQTSKDHRACSVGCPESQKRGKQIQDGGQPPPWKMEKLWYLHNRLTNFDEIWHGDASPPSGRCQPLRFQEFDMFKYGDWLI